MPPEKSKGGRPSVACVICRAARRACDGKFADCAKYVSLPTTASDAPGPSQPASPPPSRPVRSKVSPGGSEHRGAPVALAAEPAYSPDEKMRDYTDRRYDLKQRRTSEEAVVAVGEQLASAGWAADAVIEEDGRTRSGQLDSKQAGGRLMELLVVAFASVSPDAPLSLQLEQAAGSLGKRPLQAGMQPPAAAATAAAGEPLPGKALGKRKAGAAEPQADGAGGKTRAAPAARLGRPPSLAASGAASMDTVQAIARQAHGAPRKAKAAFDAQLEAAEGASSSTTIVAKAKAVSQNLFLSSGNLTEVVASLLQRPELRPILSALGWSDSQRRRGSDDAVVTSIRDFLATHLHSDGTRFSEQQAAFNVLVQAAAGPLVKSERHIAAAAEALGVRYATFRELLDVRAKMDAEAAHEVKVGGTLLLVCRYDSNQRTGGKRVRRFDAEPGSDGRIRFEVHEKRTLPCSRKELCERFIKSPEYSGA
ncbi:hypothetical protein EMIHUDRAFT_238299 [Emiliania huxleyi CCMP1516]|uniref:Uncharacterized protein n=2 Tax=Emiliania huxleyi TaxID=2903 RepID=A0A0D3JMR2_EMIH1|nr:hypothetical protein EMIHUDRAFT_238299 [Emiliania huxleyi CCMP1516]EOD24797.1 hypothetical protein EMIHUDRAFT_238299 [Emiliania huxleyi CCMP1516]|eukprot:XP_005777226.1 hypothetical protein EMIHUDRAFT_238299 [Emiliania huxleyi CCMP1516]